jgi:flagellin
VSANTDGAVTLLQKIDSLDLGYNDVSASATAIEDPWTKKSATTASFLNVTTGAVAATLAASSDTTHVYEIDLGGSPDDADKVGFTINGTNIVAETTLTNIAAAGYAKDKVGVSKWLNSQLQAATNAKGFSFEVGYVAAATNVYVTVTHSGADMIKDEGATPFASTNALTVGTQADAANAINTIDAALNTVNAQRADLGAVSNRMDSAIANLTNMSVNLSGGKSRIEDADFAAETAQLTKSQILQQAATSMLAQANASKQSVLSLLQG